MRISALACSVLASVVGALVAAPALANDSTAELTTGGLLFVYNDQIQMRSEDLAISAKEVSVRYRFFNKSDKPVTVLVAFPLPDIHLESPDDVVTVPTEDPVNLLDFTTTVNGKPVTTEVEQRVLAAGIDRTQVLRSLGIPLAPHLTSTNEALDRLPADKWESLLRIGLAETEEYDSGQGPQRHLVARWTLQTTYYWEQTFAPLSETVIEHRYKPSIGASVQTQLGALDAAKESWFDEYKLKYCMDSEFLGAVERARRAAKGRFGAPFSEERIDYILKTGANWSGPIAEFRLLVDKGAADNLVAFCGQDVRKIGDTQFEMKKTDYTPDGNLSVLILKRLQPQ